MKDMLANPTPAAVARELDRQQAGTAAVAAGTGRWLVSWSGKPQGRPTLLCVPPSGSGCGRFRAWQTVLGDAVAVVGVQLPGREERLGEPLPSSLDEVVTAVTEEALELADPDQPLVVFGESFGGLIAYELTRRLAERGRGPVAMVLAACEPPHLRRDAEDLVAFARQGLAGRDLDDDTTELVIELVRKDGALVEGYRVPAQPGVDSEVHVWGGESDDLVSAAKLDEWARFLGREVARRQFAGGHMFAMHHAVEIPRLLAEIVTPQGVPC
jgi:surfactin synthase thioesterase subunit